MRGTIHNEPYKCPPQLQQTQNLIKLTLRMHNEMIHPLITTYAHTLTDSFLNMESA